MENLNVKTLKKSTLIGFAKNSAKLYAVRKNTVFFIDRLKLEEVLSYLCLLCEFNEQFMYVRSDDISSWLRGKNLWGSEFLQEFSDMRAQYSIKDV